jgi:hypothetical protein
MTANLTKNNETMKSRIHKYHNRKTGKEQIGLQIKTAYGWAHLCYPNPPGGLFIPENEVVLRTGENH